MKICMAGALGRMGRRILEMTVAADDAEIGSAFDAPANAGTVLSVGGESGAPHPVIVLGSAVQHVPCWIREIRPVDVKALRAAEQEKREAQTAERAKG